MNYTSTTRSTSQPKLPRVSDDWFIMAEDIMAEAKKKRMSKAEKLEKIIEGRQKWEATVSVGTAILSESYLLVFL